MSKFDSVLKTIWLAIGAIVLCWLVVIRVPHEWERWKHQRNRDNRPAPTRQERGVVVGSQAASDRDKRIQRQGLRFGTIVDPSLKSAYGRDVVLPLKDSDWLLIPIQLAQYSQPKHHPPALSIQIDKRKAYSWKSGGIGRDYDHLRLQAVNLVFYRRDGLQERLLLDRPAWIQSVALPKAHGGPYYYEIAVSDSNGDDRIDEKDSITLWSSNADGSELQLVWMPSGIVEPKRYREPVSGDLFGTVVADTDGDGRVSEYDRHSLFRIAFGDTSARTVVSDSTIAVVEKIVFGAEADEGN